MWEYGNIHSYTGICIPSTYLTLIEIFVLIKTTKTYISWIICDMDFQSCIEPFLSICIIYEYIHISGWYIDITIINYNLSLSARRMSITTIIMSLVNVHKQTSWLYAIVKQARVVLRDAKDTYYSIPESYEGRVIPVNTIGEG